MTQRRSRIFQFFQPSPPTLSIQQVLFISNDLRSTRETDEFRRKGRFEAGEREQIEDRTKSQAKHCKDRKVEFSSAMPGKGLSTIKINIAEVLRSVHAT